MEIDPNDVLKQFTTLCNTDHALFQHHLASNSVLEWFGRTIRGRANVYPYYRFDLSLQYEHDFEKATKCEAFETKPSHMQTKILPEADKIRHRPQNDTEMHTTLSTPFQRIATPTLPKVGKAKDFFASPETRLAPSESIPTDNITPPQNIATRDDEAPPAKRLKSEETSGCAGDAQHVENEITSVDADPRETNCDIRKEIVFEFGQGDCSVATPHNSLGDRTISDTGYSDLKYLQSIGFLRNRNNTKHRGVTETNISSDTSSKTPNNEFNPTNDLTNSPHVRKTKLKLSYRTRRHDNQLQFALIAYEHFARNPATRRNLLCEFQKTNDSDSDAIPSTKLTVSASPSVLKPKKSLKRSLRLF